MPKTVKRLLLGLGAFLLLVILLFKPMLNFAASLLIREDDLPAKARFIYLLPGSVVTRAPRAAELLRQGRATQIYFPASEMKRVEEEGLAMNEAEMTVRKLQRLGVKPTEIVVLSELRSSSSFEDALALRRVLSAEAQPREVIVVTSWYHSRRAAWIFDKVFEGAGIRFHFATSYDLEPPVREWWKEEDGVVRVFTEYLKWGYYLYTYSFRAAG